MLHRTFFPFLLIASVLSWDHFQFDITFTCNFNDRQTYNLKIEWWEVDSIFSGEDQISQPKVLSPNIGRFSFTMDGALNGEETLSNGYKPKAYISHDCTEDHKRVDLELTITKLCRDGHSCHYRLIQDLTNYWGQKEIDIPGNAFKEDDMTPFPDFP